MIDTAFLFTCISLAYVTLLSTAQLIDLLLKLPIGSPSLTFCFALNYQEIQKKIMLLNMVEDICRYISVNKRLFADICR